MVLRLLKFRRGCFLFAHSPAITTKLVISSNKPAGSLGKEKMIKYLKEFTRHIILVDKSFWLPLFNYRHSIIQTNTSFWFMLTSIIHFLKVISANIQLLIWAVHKPSSSFVIIINLNLFHCRYRL